MPDRCVTLYLDPPLLASAKAGDHNYINRLAKAFASAGYETRFAENGAKARAASVSDPGYSLFHMDPPTHYRALTTRRAYFYPFWRIEKVAERWAFHVAREEFVADAVDPDAAARFYRFWQKRLFGEAAQQATRDRFVFVPLQGRLAEHRSFQTMSPLDMIRATLRALPDHDVVATLHPGETYQRSELKRLQALCDAEDRLTLVDLPAETLLQTCDMVVTQNSAVALSGFFFGKPAVLFARIDFHHIAANVVDLGVEAAFARAKDPVPPFDRYIHWFLQEQSINAGKDIAEAKILEAVRRGGWQM